MFVNDGCGAPRHFGHEDEAKAYITGVLDAWFHIRPEVHIRHPDGNLLRVDFLIAPKDRDQFGRPFVGLEVKKGFTQYRDFSSALRQCHDYTHCVIEEKTTPNLNGQKIPLVFLFPPISDTNLGYREWEKGSIRTIGPLNVGVVFESRGRNGENVVTLSLCGNTWWDSEHGPWGGSDKWNSKPKVGSR